MRLIDANELEKLHCEDCNADVRQSCKDDPVCASLMWVRDAPTIDPETLRPTGRWVMKETMIRSPYAKNAYCSECLEETGYSYNYCPNCGAKMMEE